MTKNELVSFFREEKRRDAEISFEDYLASNEENFCTVEETFFWRELNRELIGAIEKLSELEQKMLRLKYWLGFSNIDISEIFKISPHNVTIILGRAGEKLGKILNREEAKGQ